MVVSFHRMRHLVLDGLVLSERLPTSSTGEIAMDEELILSAPKKRPRLKWQ
jgi:hypothetical protein